MKLLVLHDHLDNSLYSRRKTTKLLVKKGKVNSKTTKLIKEIFNIFISFLNIKENLDTAYLNKFIVNRENFLEVLSKEKLSPEENKIIREIGIFLNLHHDFILASLK